MFARMNEIDRMFGAMDLLRTEMDGVFNEMDILCDNYLAQIRGSQTQAD